jgi:hypothetical protein
MPGKCPGCGATTTPEARFCRRCGAPLKTGGGHETSASISPVAQTVPLADEGRATDGLAAEESQRLGEGTSRIKRAEMDDLLRRIARDHSDALAHDRDGDGLSQAPTRAQADGSSKAVPVTSGLNVLHAEVPGLQQTESGSTPQTATAPDASPAQASATSPSPPPAQALSKKRSGLRWRWAALALLFVVLGAGLLAVISIRRSRASNPGSTAAAPSSEEPQTRAAEAGEQQIEPVSVESTPPANTPAPSPARARDAEAATHPATPTTHAVSSVSPAPVQPAPTPDAGEKTPPPQPAPPALSATDRYQRGVQLWPTDRRAALEAFRSAVPGVPDAYYYLGSEYYPEGRDARTLSDGELRAALNYFLRATSGPHSAQASRSAHLLGKEYERRKKKQSRQ